MQDAEGKALSGRDKPVTKGSAVGVNQRNAAHGASSPAMAPGQRDKRRQGELTKGVANKLARRMQPKRKKLTLFSPRGAICAPAQWVLSPTDGRAARVALLCRANKYG